MVRQNKFSEASLNLGGSHLSEMSIRQSIEVSENNNSYAVNIALNLKKIDEAAIERTIIMVRKYKFLHFGCHEYGETVTFKRTD